MEETKRLHYIPWGDPPCGLAQSTDEARRLINKGRNGLRFKHFKYSSVVPSFQMAPNWSRDYDTWSKKEKANFRAYGTRHQPKAKAKATRRGGKGMGKAPPKPPPLQRTIGYQPKLQASQGTTIGRQRSMKAPIIWKIACADAPTRSTQDYNRFLSSYLPMASTAVLPDNFKEDTVFVYNPAYAANQLACWDTTVSGAIALQSILRTEDTVSFKPIGTDPQLYGNIPKTSRVAQLSAALTLCTKFPGSSGMLNIRRLTQQDAALNGADLAASLKSDTISTYHLPLTGNQRWNMHCGVHSMTAYGNLMDYTQAPLNYGYTEYESLGGLIFSFTNVLTGPAIAQPGISVLAGSNWTQELAVENAYTKDAAPERSVVDAKNLHSHQARMGPFETNTKHNSKATVGVLNSLAHGIDSMTKSAERGGEAVAAGYGVITAGLNSARVVNGMIEAGMIAIA